MKSNSDIQDLSFHDWPQILTQYYQFEYANQHSPRRSPLFLKHADMSVKFWFHRGEAMYISLIDFQQTSTETKSFQ